MSGLRLLEYRGYDSAGIGALRPGRGQLCRRRVQGGVSALGKELERHPLRGSMAVGHTRWATHGMPSPENAHPHVDCSQTVGVVHNGIVENFSHLRGVLSAAGHHLLSGTDTELLIHLVEDRLGKPAEPGLEALVEAVRHALVEAEGAHACLVFSADHPDTLICARRAAAGGLRIALRDDRAYVSSDGAALAVVTGAKTTCVVPPDTIAIVQPNTIRMFGLFDEAAVPVRWVPLPRASAVGAMPELSGSTAFFREAMEQPATLARQATAVSDILAGHVPTDTVRNGSALVDAVHHGHVKAVRLLACGTPMYACLAARDYIQGVAGMPAVVEPAHEFAHSAYARTFAPELAVVVSQSGETADSLLALEKAKAGGALCVAVTNTVGSSLDQAADVAIYLQCGPEYSVAQTKAFTGAIVALLGLAGLLADHDDCPATEVRQRIRADLSQLPGLGAQALDLASAHLAPVVDRLAPHQSCLFLGRGLGYPVALEGALKLKELSYIHAEGYPAGELKHGPIALIEPGYPVLAVVGKDECRPKMLSQLAEVSARGAWVTVVAEEDDLEARQAASLVVPVPRKATQGLLLPVLTVMPLQLLAGRVAGARGHDVDRPRNLAKSVTVI